MKRLLLILFTTMLLISCSSQSTSDMSLDEYSFAQAPEYDVPAVEESVTNQRFDPSKVIKTGQFSIETRTFDDDLEVLNNDLEQFEGFIESSSISLNNYRTKTRVATYRLRIPSDSFDGFTEVLKAHFTVLSESTQNQSVADTYYDAENRIKVLTTQQDRLLELVEQAETVEEIVFLQEQLMDVEQELEYNKSTLQRLDDQIDYSTITVTIIELEETDVLADQDNFFSQIGRAFTRGINNLGHNLSRLIIFTVENILLLFLLIGLAVFGVKRYNRKNKPKESKIDKN